MCRSLHKTSIILDAMRMGRDWPVKPVTQEFLKSIHTSRHLGTNRFLNEWLSDNALIDKSTSTLPNDRSRCLVNHLHLFFIHPATVHFDSRDSSVDLTKVRRRQRNIDCS